MYRGDLSVRLCNGGTGSYVVYNGGSMTCNNASIFNTGSSDASSGTIYLNGTLYGRYPTTDWSASPSAVTINQVLLPDKYEFGGDCSQADVAPSFMCVDMNDKVIPLGEPDGVDRSDFCYAGADGYTLYVNIAASFPSVSDMFPTCSDCANCPFFNRSLTITKEDAEFFY